MRVPPRVVKAARDFLDNMDVVIVSNYEDEATGPPLSRRRPLDMGRPRRQTPDIMDMSKQPSGGEGRRRPGRPTVRDVAAAAGVSKSLVSLVVRGAPHVSDAKRTAVLRAMDELGYEPPAGRPGPGRAVGVMLHDLRNPWFVDLLDGLTDALAAGGLDVLLADARGGRRNEDALVRTFTQARVRGLVLVGMVPVSGRVAELVGQLPTVVAANPESGLPAADTVVNDDVAGAELAVRHLVGLGHRHIAHVSGWGAVGERREQGYRQAMAAAGLGRHIRVETGDLTEEGGYRAGIRLLAGSSATPSAVFVVNDVACIGVQDAAEELGRSVPSDLSLVGYDNTPLARLRHLWLTSVDPAGAETGRVAAGLLLDRISQPTAAPRLEVLAPSLAVRGSTGRLQTAEPTGIVTPAERARPRS